MTFPNHTLLGEETIRWITSLGEQGLTGTQWVALAMLREEEALDNRADRRPALLAALGEQTLSRAELAARTGLSDQTVRRWLAILRQEGTIELAGDTPPRSRHARYRRTHQDPLFPPGHSPK